MSADRIKESALLRFAHQGYDATSLADIAGDVGIKPPSIYSHFSSKQVLFWQLVEYASGKELETIQRSLWRPLPIVEAMHIYLHEIINRFATEPHLRFWLRTIYLPPAKMYQDVTNHNRNFAATLENIVSTALKHPEFGLKKTALPHETLTTAFIGMLRSVHAELLYCGGADSEKILSAMWVIFERASCDAA